MLTQGVCTLRAYHVRQHLPENRILDDSCDPGL